MIETTLKRLLDLSDFELVDGERVEGYYYPDTTDGVVRLILDDVDCVGEEFDQQQVVTLANGEAVAIDVNGEPHKIEFFVQRPLLESDVL